MPSKLVTRFKIYFKIVILKLLTVLSIPYYIVFIAILIT